MTLLEFTVKFGSEKACRAHFKKVRDGEGVVCKGCNETEHYWLSAKQMYQCRNCGFRTSLRSGTIMESSKLPFQYWFFASYLMANTKKDISAYQMQRELGHKRYEPIWAMMHKIRKAMGQRDSKYLLNNEVEVDEGFFETLVPEDQKDEVRKRGRGSQKQTMAMVFAESKISEKKTKHRPGRSCGYFKMIVCPDFTAETASDAIDKAVDRAARKITDGYSTYKALEKTTNLITQVTPSQQAHIKLPWVHIAIGNVKRILNGIFHHIKPEYLQGYLDEFCYKLNRRYMKTNVFHRCLVAMTLT